MPLTEQQELIASKVTGRYLVSACPGSGKTHTVITRSDRLFGHGKRLLLAFNKAAQLEMQKRAKESNGAMFMTFHGFCLREVKSNWDSFGFTQSPDIEQRGMNLATLSEANRTAWYNWGVDTGLEKETTMKLARFYFDHELEEKEKAAIEFLEGYESQLKAENRTDHEIEILLRDSPARFMKNGCRAVLNYRAFLKKNNKVTFDTMILHVADEPEKIKQTCDHFIIDEYQDVDRFQYRIAKHFAENTKSWMAVGDPRQRIYDWRGALADVFGAFKKDYPDTEILPLTTNFRSYDGIIDLAENICEVGMTGVRGTHPEQMDVVEKSTGLEEALEHLDPVLKNNAVLCRYNREVAQAFLVMIRNNIKAYINQKGDLFGDEHMQLALKYRKSGYDISQLQDTKEWETMLKQPRFRDPDERQMVKDDSAFILGLTDREVDSIYSMSDKNGVTISTIHKTKGLEWPTVFVRRPQEWIGSDIYVNYVGVTRARNQLILYKY